MHYYHWIDNSAKIMIIIYKFTTLFSIFLYSLMHLLIVKSLLILF